MVTIELVVRILQPQSPRCNPYCQKKKQPHWVETKNLLIFEKGFKNFFFAINFSKNINKNESRCWWGDPNLPQLRCYPLRKEALRTGSKISF